MQYSKIFLDRIANRPPAGRTVLLSSKMSSILHSHRGGRHLSSFPWNYRYLTHLTFKYYLSASKCIFCKLTTLHPDLKLILVQFTYSQFKLLSFVLSIPATSAFSERIFSLMNNKWRDERNRSLLNLIKSELIVSVNSDSSCAEFYDLIKNNKLLLESVKSQKKNINLNDKYWNWKCFPFAIISCYGYFFCLCFILRNWGFCFK